MGLSFVGSGVLGLLSLPFATGPQFNAPVLGLLCALAVASGLLVVWLAPHLPERLLVVGLLLCVGLVSTAVAVTDGPGSPYVLFYAWIGVEAAYFLSRRAAVPFTVAAAVASAVTLQLFADPGDVPVATWVMVVGTMVAVAVLTGALRKRSDDLIGILADRAIRDSLTGLPNRRGYHERIEQELERARRHDLPLSIVLADIDDFKSLNDKFGHRLGDDALRSFAALVTSELRCEDLVSRVGGEEFAIVLPHVDERGALVTAERLRRAVRGGLVGPDGRSLSASFGVASFPQHGSDPEVLLDHADQAMYAAKHLGRDRTVVFSDGLLESLREDAPAEQLQAVLVLAEALDLRDSGTATHSQTVGTLCAGIALALGMPEERVERIRLAGILHDVGKLAVPDDILQKPGKLTDAEYAELKKHSALGARVIAAAGMEDISNWVLAHHERPDGRGYPMGLSGDQIPIEARILAVGDSYEAMTSDRPYRKAPGHEYALQELQRWVDQQFDADVVAALIATVSCADGVPVGVRDGLVLES